MEEGRGFSDALARHPAVFDLTFTSLVRAGEATGALRTSLERIADLLEIRARLRRRVQEAMIYPTVLLVIISVVVFFMTTFVLPRFARMFEELDAELPAMTQAVLFGTKALASSWPFLVPIIPLVIVGIRRVLRTPRAREVVDRAKLGLPLVGKLHSEAYLFQMFVSLGMLLGTRVPLLEAIKITRGTVRNVTYDRFFDALAESVEDGRGMALPFSRAAFLPDAVKLMVATGESSGALDVVMVRLAERYRESLESDIRKLSTVIEPVMLVVMGIVVGAIVISLVLPLFKLSQAIR
jgi:type IV pilus assembly protein PilC